MTKPLGMDDASWALIQRLQQEDDRVLEGEDELLEEMSSAGSRKRIRGEGPVDVVVVDLTGPEVASAPDAPMAYEFHLQERQRLRLLKKQERRDRAVAYELLQQQEEELRKASTKPACCHDPCHTQALEYVKNKAKAMHDKALPELQQRVRDKLPNYEVRDLEQCLEYMCNDAPVIIHMNEALLATLVKDTHYRDLFETKTSGGSTDEAARMQWEKIMFGDAHDSATPFQRPKYGCPSISGDIQGCARARCYGNTFIILQPHVRERCTFFDKHTSALAATETLATNEYYAHILHRFIDDDLSSAMTVCTLARIRGSPSKSHTYKEVQIHGPIQLDRDVLALSVPGRERTADATWRELVLKFQKKTSCNILWQQDLLHPED
jgi:hypothetical protein